MSKKLYFLISFVLVMSLASISYGADPCVVGNWEGNDDGWIDWQLPGQPLLDTAGPPKYTYSPTMGVTRGKKSLKVTPPAGWQQNISVLLENRPGARGAFLANNSFAIDVTYNSADWDPCTTYAQLYQLSISATNYLWNDVGGAAAQTGMNGVVFTDTLNPDSPGNLPLETPGVPGVTRKGTWIWNYSAILPGGSYPGAKITTTPTTGYIGIVFATNSNTVGSYYFDNAILFDSAYAHHPEPFDAQTNVPVDANLTWMAGDNAQYHDIYFGTSFDEVNDAEKTDPCGPTEVYRARQDVGNEDYNIPETLGIRKTYYWRVDEVNDACEPYLWKGNVWSFTTEGKAVNPTPADMATEIDIVGLKLSWTPGCQAASHDVYLGTTLAEVNDADNSGTPGPNEVYRARQDANSYNIPETLGIGKTYYWRIDEVNDALPPGLWKGDIWQFTTKLGKAKNPNPADGKTGVSAESAKLSWTAGPWAATVDGHDVYFGSNFADVNSADHNDPEFKGRQSSTTYNPGILDLDTIYYWRIDEVNTAHLPDQIWRGDVWSFTTADYTPVEDFESYADVAALRKVWNKGTTRAVITPVTDANYVHGDIQSMQFAYRNNSSPYYSEAYANTTDPNALPSGIGSNWSAVKLLVLYFSGLAANDPNEPMYVTLTDGSSPAHTATVLYDDDATDLRDPNWHEWNIPLSEFTGVDMSNVKRIAIGLGDKVSSPSWSSYIYFDDIRLYVPRCVPSKTLAGDIDNDCDADFDDLEFVVTNWLISDYNVTPVNPTGSNLVGWWKLDEASGTVADDSSVSGNDGNVINGPLWIAGKVDGALRLDGTDDYVDLPIDSLISSLTNSTFATWVDFNSASTGGWERIFDFGTDTMVYMLLTPRIGTTGVMRFAITRGSSGSEQQVNASATLAGGWHHVAVTIDADNDTFSLYLDGELVGQNTAATLTPSSLGSTTNNWLGRSQWDTDAYFSGSLDDFRIYNRALSQGEVAWLAGKATEFAQPLYLLLTPNDPNIDVYDDGKINFKDYAVLANDWLKEQLWP